MQTFQVITMLFSITPISVPLVHFWFISIFVVPLATVVVRHCSFSYSCVRLFPPWCVYCPAASSLSRLAPFCCLHIGDIPFVLLFLRLFLVPFVLFFLYLCQLECEIYKDFFSTCIHYFSFYSVRNFKLC